jgi:hypothetical protein
MKRLFIVTVFGLVATPLVVGGQSLAEMAKKEEARRKTIKQTAKVYSNEDLRRDPTADTTPPPPAPPSGNVSPAGPEPSTKVPKVDLPAGKVEPAAGEKGQAYWTERIGSARAALERSKIFADALQARINALSTDFVNRDDPAQRSQIELERQRAISELERVKKEIAAHTKAIGDIEEEARKAGVPPGWLR